MDLFDQKTLTKYAVPANSPALYQYAYPLQIRWKDEDRVSHPATPTPTPTPTQSPPATTKQGISTGAIVAIAVVVGVVALAVLAVLVWWLKQKRKRAPSTSAQNHSEWDKPELDGTERGQPSIVSQRPPEELP
jgi:hypothetical protein